MTVEEIEIIVTAKVEEALKEFKKMLPQIKQEMSKIQKELGQVDFNGLAKQVKASGIDKELSKVKQKIKETFNPADVSGLKMQGIKQEISGVSKEVQKLKGSSEQLGNAYDLQRYKQKMQELKTETQNANKEVSKVGHVKYDTKAIQKFIDSYKQGNSDTKVNTPNVSSSNVSKNIQPSQQSLGLWDTLKAKIQQIKPQVKQAQSMFNNMSINPNTKQLDLVKYKISEIEEKLQNAKEGKIHLNTKDIVKAEAELERLNNQKQKLEGNTDSRGNMFSTIFSSLKKITPQMNNISGIAVKVKNNIKLWGGGIRQGIGQIARYATALFGLQSIYSTLSSCANSWLSSQNSGAKQLSANIEYMKYAMGSALAPVIQYVTNLVYQLMKAIQSVVYALTGVNIFANASAKAYNSMASSAGKTAKSSKEASNSLADFDEIHNIQKDTGSGSGGTTTPNMDLSRIDAQLSPWQQKLYDFFKPLIDSWNTYGAGLIAQIQTTAGQVIGLISSVWGSFENIITNGTVYSILENILAIIGNIAEAFANAWNYNGNGDAIVQNLANAFNNLLTAINNVIQNPAFQEWLNNCSDKFREMSEKIASINWQPLVDALMQIGQNVGTIALTALSGIIDIFKWLVENPIVAEIILGIAVAIGVLSTAYGIWTTVTTVLTAVQTALNIAMLPLIAIILGIIAVITLIVVAIMNWDTIVQALANTWEWLKQKATEIFTAIGDFFVNIFNSIKDFFVNIWNSIKDFFVNLCISIYTKQQEIWNKIKNAISNVINGIKTTISNVLNTIKTIWNNIWNGLKTTVTNIFNGIWNAIKKVINSILGGIEGMANGVVSGVNLVIRTLNRLKFTVPDWVPGMGGKTFGFNLNEISRVSIPRLAKGGVLYEDTIIQAGEYSNARSNPEIVTPQNIMYDTIIKALKENNNTGNNETINFENKLVVNGKVFAREIIEDLNSEAVRRGYKPILQH